MNCKNCNSEINTKFCPECGQPASLKRIDVHYISHEMQHIIHFERGILYTVKELVTNPGQSIRKYLTENRTLLVKPIVFIVVTSLIYTLISHFFHIEEEYLNADGLGKTYVGIILKWIQSNYGYASILTGIFIAIWLKVFFRKYGYNFYELLIMLCFVQGISMLIFALCAFIEGISHVKLLTIAGILGILYMTWAMGAFFDKKKIGSYIKSLISLFLGIISFYIIVFIIGITIDVLTKH